MMVYAAIIKFFIESLSPKLLFCYPVEIACKFTVQSGRQSIRFYLTGFFASGFYFFTILENFIHITQSVAVLKL